MADFDSDFKIDRSLHFDKDGELKTPEALIYRPPGGTYPAAEFPDGTPAYAAGNAYRCLWPSENDDEDRFAAEYDAAQQDRARNLEEARRQGIRDGEREVACLLDQEACPCFHFHLGLAAKKCPDCCEPCLLYTSPSPRDRG